MARPRDQLFPWHLSLTAPYAISSVTGITTREKFWNVWMDEDWYINLGRMHVDGEKMKIEAVDALTTN